MNKPEVIDIDGLKLIYSFTDTNNEFCLIPFFKTGAITETNENCGITHFLEHMLGKQTIHLSEEQTLEILKLYMPKYNAITEYQYMFLIANTSVRHMEKVFSFIGDVLQNPVFTDERTKRESKVIEQEICMYEIDNISIANDNLLRIFYHYPAIKNEILGTKEKVLSYLSKDLKARFSELATKQNMILSFSGNAKREDVVALVKKYFSNIPSNPKTAITLPDIQINGKQDVVLKVKKEDNTITGIVGTNCNFNIKDKKERVMLNLLNNYLNSQGQPLWNELREKKTLVYNFCAECITTINSSIMEFFFQTTKQNIDECISAYAQITNNLAQNGLREQEFEALKESLRIIIDGQVDLCRNLSKTNAINYTRGLDFYDKNQTLSIINSITTKEFNTFLTKLFKVNFVGASFVGNISKKQLPTLNDLQTLFC